MTSNEGTDLVGHHELKVDPVEKEESHDCEWFN